MTIQRHLLFYDLEIIYIYIHTQKKNFEILEDINSTHQNFKAVDIYNNNIYYRFRIC